MSRLNFVEEIFKFVIRGKIQYVESIYVIISFK